MLPSYFALSIILKGVKKMTIREFNEQFEELSRQFGLHDVLNTFNLHLTQRIHDLQE